MKDQNKKKLDFSFRIYQSKLISTKSFSSIFSTAIIFISSFQSVLLSILGFTIIKRNEETQADSFMKSVCDYILVILSLNFEDLQTKHSAILIAVAAYFALILYFFIRGAYYLKISKEMPSTLRRFATPFSYIHSLVFFLPIQNILLNLIFEILSDSSLRNQGHYITIAVVGLLGIILNSIAALGISLFTTILKTGDYFARVQNTWIYFSGFLKFILPLLYWLHSIGVSVNSIPWYFNILNFVINFFIAYHLLETPPFYNKRISHIIYKLEIASLIISAFNLLQLGVGETGFLFSTGNFLTIIPFTLPFAIKVFQLLIHRKRMLFENSQSLYQQRSYELASFLRKLRKAAIQINLNHRLKSFPWKDLEHIGFKLNVESLHMINSEKDLANFLSEFSMKNKLPNLVNLTIANILISHCSNVSHSYLLCNKILAERDITYSERLTAYFIKGTIQDYLLSSQSQNLELIEFMNSVNNHDQLGILIQKIVAEREKFYSSISGEDDPSIEKVFQLSKKIQVLESKINTLWKGLSKQNIEDYPPLLKMFSFYKIFVELQFETGKDLLKKYQKLLIRKAMLNNNNNAKTKAAFSTHNVVVVVGVENNNFGRVMTCTLNIKKMLGMPAKDIMGKSIGIITPPTIASVHDQLLRNRLDDSTKMMTMSKIESFAVHQRGHIIPVEISATIFPNLSEGLSFWGMIKQVGSQTEYLILDDQGYIEGISSGLKAAFCFEINRKTPITFLGKLYREQSSATNSPGASKFLRYMKTKQMKSKKMQSTFSQKQSTPKDDFDEVVNDDLSAFMIDIKNFIKQDESFNFILYDNIIHKNRVTRYKCRVILKNLINKNSYYMTMKKVHHRNEMISNRGVTQRSGEFSSVHEHSVQGTRARAVKLFPGENPSVKSYASYDGKSFLEPAKNVFNEKSEISDYLQQGQQESLFEDDDDEDEEDLDLTDMSDKQMDDRASMMSVSSSKAELELQKTLSEVIKTTQYYSFKESYLLFFFMIIFLLAYFTATLILYVNAEVSITETNDRISAINHLNLRGQSLCIMMADLYPLWLFDKVFQQPFDLRAYFYLNAAIPYYTRMITQNTLLKDSITKLSDVEKEFFFKEDLRMYTDQFSIIPNSSKYQMVDSFTLTNALYSQAFYFTNNYAKTKSDPRNYALNFLFGNVVNDLWLKTLEGPKILKTSMETEVNRISNTNSLTFTIAMVTLGVLCFALILIISKSYLDTVRFTGIVVNSGSSPEILVALQNLRFYKAFLSKKLQGQDVDLKHAKQKAKTNVPKLKYGKRTELAFKTFMRIFLLIGSLFILFGLIYKSFDIFSNAESKIMPVVNDINRLNNILYTGLPVTSYLGMMFTRPTTIVVNKRIPQIIDEAIYNFSISVSVTNDFLPETLEFLNKGYCEYYIVNSVYPDCTVMFKNMGLKGIISTVIAAADYHKQYRKLIASLPLNAQTIFFLVYQYDFIEASYLITFGMATAISEYQTQMVANLISILNSASQNVIGLFIPGIIIGLFITATIAWVLYKIIWQERKWNSNTLNILPLDLIMNNKGLKSYMINETREFYKLVKRYDYIKRKEKKVVDKLKHGN